MANDLPIMLDAPRAHIWFSDVLLYFLDEHAYPPERSTRKGRGMWIAGDGRADILVRSEWPIDHLRITAESPIRTVFIVSAGRSASRASRWSPGSRRPFDVPAVGRPRLETATRTCSRRSRPRGSRRTCAIRRRPTTGTSAC